MTDTADDYDPSRYLRGPVKKFASEEADSDSCGMWERGGPIMLEVRSRQGEFSVPVHGYAGFNHKRVGGHLVEFTMKVRATLEWPDDDGQLVETEGLFRITVKGGRLDYVMRHIRLGTRTTLHESGKVEATDKPEITSITLELVPQD